MKPIDFAKLKLNLPWLLILIFMMIKLNIHFFTFDHYELHRDAYLYYALSEHLAWGFIPVPPSIAVVGKIATLLFGNTTFALRFFQAVIGAATLLIIGFMIRELKGGLTALILASLAFLLSLAYLHSNTLFQPVSFNQFYWVLSGYLILRMIQHNDPRMWLWIVLVFALAFLNKYSIVFFACAFALALLISPYRTLFRSRYLLAAVLAGFFLIMPNLVWQYEHNWPVLTHMENLQRSQLVHVCLTDFFISQVMMNLQGLFLWVSGLVMVLFMKRESRFRLFVHVYLIVILLLIAGRGKPYYFLGLYPIFFVFGAYELEKYAGKYRNYLSAFLVFWMIFVLYGALARGAVPFSRFEDFVQKDAYRWEDGINHDIPQDIADMTGWKQVAERVLDTYLQLKPAEKRDCDIFCYNYGQAGAVMFYGHDKNIPQPISFNDDFKFWSPDSLTKTNMIWVHSGLSTDIDPDSLLSSFFKSHELRATIGDQYFRENGTKIYLCRYPTEQAKIFYSSRISELRRPYLRYPLTEGINPFCPQKSIYFLDDFDNFIVPRAGFRISS